MGPNFVRANLMARLSSAAYLLDLNSISLAVAECGLDFVAVVSGPGFQAIIAQDPINKENIVIFRGTPITCGRNLDDALLALLIDVDDHHIGYPGGGKILSRLYLALGRYWPEIQGHLNMDWRIVFTGHSLGASFALAAPTQLPDIIDIEVWAFAPFQFANDGFHKVVYSNPRRQRFVFGANDDFAPGHNHADPVTTMCGPIWHMVNGGACEQETSWPIYRVSVIDHAVTDYEALTKNLADQQLIAA